MNRGRRMTNFSVQNAIEFTTFGFNTGMLSATL